MATIFHSLGAVLFFILITKGYCQCDLQDVTIEQTRTGRMVEIKPEWNVTLHVDCPCSVQELRLACDGFQTTEEIDPSVLSKSGSECLVNGGQNMPGFSSFNFGYAWDPSFPFKPLSAQISCS